MARCLLVVSLLVSAVLWSRPSAHAASATLSYAGLSDCYVLDQPLPAFTLTARVSSAGSYRITHAVALGADPAVPTMVYDGPIDPAAPQVITLPGGSAAVVGSYTLRAALYDSASALVAETSATIVVAADCPTPTPAPSIDPTPLARDRRPEIQWSQQATPRRGVAVGESVTITVRALNAGAASGTSAAVLRYDPTHLRLLDALPRRSADWVRDRDDAAGTLTLAFGSIGAQGMSTMLLRFQALAPIAETALWLAREDGQDRANPLFLTLGATLDGPLPLDLRWTEGQLVVRGRGYKPGEPIAVWGNRADGQAVPIAAGTWVREDAAGSVEFALPPLDVALTSLVAVGRISDVTGSAPLVPAATAHCICP